MRKKYLFFDIDGTLATGLTTVMPESGARCLERLRANGHFTAIATGRLQASAAVVAQRYGFTHIVADGGYSLTLDGEVIEMQSLPVTDCVALLDRLVRQRVPWAVTLENERVCLTADERYLAVAPSNYFPVTVDPAFDYRGMDKLYKVYIACTPENQGEIDLGGLPTVRYNQDVLFIEPVCKQRGIRRMLDVLGVPDEDVAVFGDGTNDVCMFGQGWLSVAMGNACAALKEKADYITTSVDQDGLWNACRHFGWI